MKTKEISIALKWCDEKLDALDWTETGPEHIALMVMMELLVEKLKFIANSSTARTVH